MVLAGMGKNFLEFWHPGAHPCTLWQMTVGNGTAKLIQVNQKEKKNSTVWDCYTLDRISIKILGIVITQYGGGFFLVVNVC